MSNKTQEPLKTNNKKAKSIHSPLHQVTYHCNYCNQKFLTFSTSAQDIRTGPCSNCNPFYSGSSASEVKMGAVEKYHQRAQKVKENPKNSAK